MTRSRAGVRYKTAEQRHDNRIQLRMTDEELKRLDDAADELGVTRTAFIREAVESHIKLLHRRSMQ